MKHMRAVESDSVKSARKAKDKPVKGCQKLMSELCKGRNKTECTWQVLESHETMIDF